MPAHTITDLAEHRRRAALAAPADPAAPESEPAEAPARALAAEPIDPEALNRLYEGEWSSPIGRPVYIDDTELARRAALRRRKLLDIACCAVAAWAVLIFAAQLLRAALAGRL